MADTLANVTLTANTWVNLNTETSIAVTTSMLIQNLEVGDVRIVEQASGTPTVASGYNKLAGQREGQNPWLQIDSPAGAIWAYSNNNGLINVQAI